MVASKVELEMHLEDWIAEDSSLLEAGLTVVGRQVYTAGGPLDLLAIDLRGRWVVIEIKRGRVRRDTIVQAIDYASCIVEMDADELRLKTDPYLKKNPVGGLCTLDEVMEKRGLKLNTDDERDVSIMIVGTAQDGGLDRMVHFLGERHNLPISVVTFQVFALTGGEQVLVRELTESDDEPEALTQRKVRRNTLPTLEEFYKLAETEGTREPIQKFVEGGERAGFPIRVYKESIFLASPNDKRNCYIGVVLKPTKEGRLRVWTTADSVAKMLGVSEDSVVEAIGSGWTELYPEDMDGFVERLVSLASEADKSD